MAAHRTTFLARILSYGVKLYQYVGRPFVGSHCRFHPSCSDYALEALQRHGAYKGLWLMSKRLLRCHPWCAGGYDPVPQDKKM
jgi:putative membrane protein insertion efficiency factor